ncbi:MAG: hypothetical protein R3E91_04780 [Chlamydiales bacterium]
MKIDFLVAENRYGSTLHFAKAFAKALERMGVDTRLHWIGEGEFFHAFHQIMADPPDLTCSFSNIHLSGQPIGDLWQIPHLSLLVDPAIYCLPQLLGQYSWVSCVDYGDLKFLQELNFKNVFYLPHGADRNLLTPPGKERLYEVVFFGSCVEYLVQEEIVLHATNRVLSSQTLSILQALIELGIPQERLVHYHTEVDLCVRFYDRIRLLSALKSHEIHIWGQGPWKKYLPYATIHPPVSFDQAIKIMQKAQVVVNSSPRFKRGLHERILYAALCGAAVLSTHEGGYCYQYGKWEDQQFKDWQEVAYRLQTQVLNEHTWDHRAATLLEYFHFLK